MKKYIWLGLLALVALGVASWMYADRSVTVPQPEPVETTTPSPKASMTTNEKIVLDTPAEGQKISSPLTIRGEARGYWFFEASFPVVLTDWDGLIIAQGIATADGEWMTEDWVPFTAEIEFDKPSYGERGSLILRRDNPSGLPENDDAYEITVYFE